MTQASLVALQQLDQVSFPGHLIKKQDFHSAGFKKSQTSTSYPECVKTNIILKGCCLGIRYL